MKNYKNKIFHIDSVSSLEILAKYPTPLYIYSESKIQENYLDFYNSSLEANIYNPLICFALKANNNIHLLKSLAKLGAGADIVSGGELKQALRAKIPANKIVFSGVGKTSKEIESALLAGKNGIYSFNVESIEELEEINIIAKKLNKIANISLRLNPKVQAKTHKHISTGHKTHKFGILKEDILKSIKNISKWRNINLRGLSIHIGSQLKCLKATKKAIAELCNVANLSNRHFEFLDVGGGLGVDYEKNNDVPTALEYMKLVKDTIDKNLIIKDNKHPRIVFEPGRFIAASCGHFFTKVLRTKTSEDCHFVIIDGGMNDFVRSSLYGAYHEILPIKIKSKSTKIINIVGPICETTDCFASKREMQIIKKDDYLTVEDVGAYGYTMSSTYNMREKIKEVVITCEGKTISK